MVDSVRGERLTSRLPAAAEAALKSTEKEEREADWRQKRRGARGQGRRWQQRAGSGARERRRLKRAAMAAVVDKEEEWAAVAELAVGRLEELEGLRRGVLENDAAMASGGEGGGR